MRYDPSSATQNSGDIAPGTYRFEVAAAVEGKSKAGNDVIKLVLSVTIPNIAAPISIYDYLVPTPGGLWKVKQFAAETGLDFDAGEITETACNGRTGLAVFGFDKKEQAEVAAGTRERAYLKVVRYGVAKDKLSPPAKYAAEPGPSEAEASGGDGLPADDSIPF